jgi:hypothetical protein
MYEWKEECVHIMYGEMGMDEMTWNWHKNKLARWVLPSFLPSLKPTGTLWHKNTRLTLGIICVFVFFLLLPKEVVNWPNGHFCQIIL